MAQIAVKDSDEALDIVQDAMLTLARKYADKPPAEWAPLFHRILQNRITDWHRRGVVKNRIFGIFRGPADNDETDPVAAAAGSRSDEPDYRVQMSGATARLDNALHGLPRRQQQAFLLRSYEGLSVRETATSMKCSEGSVKTHYSRAVHTLRDLLEGDWP